MAKKAAAFGMRVIYHNRTKSASVTEAEFVDFETLLKSSDVIALGLPLKVSDGIAIEVYLNTAGTVQYETHSIRCAVPRHEARGGNH